MKRIPNRLEDGISVTPDIRATHVAMMSGVLHRSSTPMALMSGVLHTWHHCPGFYMPHTCHRCPWYFDPPPKKIYPKILGYILRI